MVLTSSMLNYVAYTLGNGFQVSLSRTLNQLTEMKLLTDIVDPKPSPNIYAYYLFIEEMETIRSS